MKTAGRVLGLAIVAIALSTAALASEQGKADVTFNREQAEINLLIGLASDNLGLRESAAYMLGEIGSRKAVVPLMAMLHDGQESSRIVAALALARIGEARGAYAVKRAAKYDESPRVQQLAAWYYTEYVEPGAFEFIASGPVPSSPAYASDTDVDEINVK